MASLKDCQECSRVSNNKYFNCPPRMSDGRHFTDYRPRCFGQYLQKINNNLPSSFDYRMYLTHNASEIMQNNAYNAYSDNRCGPCEEPYDIGTMLPEQSKQVCNSRMCSFNQGDNFGVGVGRQYIDPEIEKEKRKDFLDAKIQENEYMKYNINCCTNISDDAQYYPIDGSIETVYDRYSSPSGGVPLSGGDKYL